MNGTAGRAQGYNDPLLIRRHIRASRILDDLKKVALQMEADSKRYLEIRDRTKDRVRHEYWRAMAINNHETARMLLAFIDKYIYY